MPRPTKSIILGGGHPIIVPDKNSHLAVASTSTVNTAKLASPGGKKLASTLVPTSPSVDALRIPKSATMGSIPVEVSSSGFVATGGGSLLGSPGGKISDVDEFCPDGGVLDKSFLDDAVDAPVGMQESNPGQESDSEDDSHHNPLVSRFDDEFVGDGADQSTERLTTAPIATNSPRRSNPLRQDLTPSPNPVVDRAFSMSSMELEIDRVDPANADSGSLNDSESWSLDTKERRSPEGGEDVGSNVSITCSKSSSVGKKVCYFSRQCYFPITYRKFHFYRVRIRTKIRSVAVSTKNRRKLAGRRTNRAMIDGGASVRVTLMILCRR